MIFTNQELGAILKMATVMADADGKVTNEETTLMFVELVRFGVVSEDKVNAARKSKVDDNTARMQSIKQLGV